MENFREKDPSELPGYLGGATAVVLLALAAEHLSVGNTLAAIVLAVIAISCFYIGAGFLVRELERGDDPPTAP